MLWKVLLESNMTTIKDSPMSEDCKDIIVVRTTANLIAPLPLNNYIFWSYLFCQYSFQCMILVFLQKKTSPHHDQIIQTMAIILNSIISLHLSFYNVSVEIKIEMCSSFLLLFGHSSEIKLLVLLLLGHSLSEINTLLVVSGLILIIP